MPKTELVVSVFISSPSDVGPEREVLENLIRELNGTWSRTLGLRLDPIRWETDARPAFGSDPQAVLNEQLPDDYDVVIGILWGKIGTPTPRADSGTMEEFERAFRRHRTDRDSVELMIYFKDAGIPPSKVDPAQLEKVNSFRASLGDKGGLYSTFEDLASFESSARAHLSSLAQAFSKQDPRGAGGRIRVGEVVNQPDLSESDDDEYGLLEYVDIYESRMGELTLVLETITKATARVGEQMSARAQDLEAQRTGENDPKKIKSLLRMSSDHI